MRPHCFRPPKPFWKKAVYSGSSAARHKRTNFTNAPLNVDWVLEAIGEVPKLEDVSGAKVCVPSFDLEFHLFHQTPVENPNGTVSPEGKELRRGRDRFGVLEEEDDGPPRKREG